jgi:hypothetical protein
MPEWFEEFNSGPSRDGRIGIRESSRALARARMVRQLPGSRTGDNCSERPFKRSGIVALTRFIRYWRRISALGRKSRVCEEES